VICRGSAGIEERLLVSAYSPSSSRLWSGFHGLLSLPLHAVGRTRFWTGVRSGRELGIATLGRAGTVEALLDPLLGELQLERTGSLRPLLPPRAAGLVESGADLVLVVVHPWLVRLFRDRGWLVVPSAVRWRALVREVPPRDPSRSLSEDLRKVRGAEFRAEIAGGSSRDWEEFFGEILRPHATRRFGEDAWHPSGAFRRKLEAVGRLLFVRAEGRRVAGACLVTGRGGLWIPLGGLRRDGGMDWLREGAGAALYLHIFRWAREQGIGRVDMGRSRPFPDDGVAHYKSKWGLRPEPDPLVPRVVLLDRSARSGHRSVFADRPVYRESGGRALLYAGGEPTGASGRREVA